MCYVEAKTGVRIRKGPGTHYSSVGLLPKGHYLYSSCHITHGGHYSDCGGSNRWVEVEHHGHWGYYVAYRCVRHYYDDHDRDDHASVQALQAEDGDESTAPVPEPIPVAEG